MVTSLLNKIDDRKREIAQMKQALNLLESPPTYPVDRGQLPVLAKLEALLSAAANQEEKAQRLQLAREALVETERELAELETQRQNLEPQSEEALAVLSEKVRQYNQKSQELQQLGEEIKKHVSASLPTWQALYGRANGLTNLPPRIGTVRVTGLGATFIPG